MTAEQIRERLQRALAPDQYRDVVELIDRTGDEGWSNREKTVNQLVAHLPGIPVRRVVEHLYSLEATLSEQTCPFCSESAGS